MSTNLRPSPGSASTVARPGLVLAVVCVAVFTINVDTTLVNVLLPTLVDELGASTSELQWVVDAYNLTFAAFVLAAGSLSDRFGRKGGLLLGLALFGAASVAGAFVDTTWALITARTVMGVGAAMVFPNTLSILTNVFPDRNERAKAIGVWGATTGIGVAFGPIVGGFLIERFWWGSAFLVMGPVAAIAIGLVARVVPPSRDPAAPRLDFAGLALSTLAAGLLVYAIIEAPHRGWGSVETLAGLGSAVVLLVGFVQWERRTPAPMLDVALFRNLRFSAASGSVTVAFFALFGFVFTVTMYFQFMHGYSPLGTGLRTLPVAVSMGAASVFGTKLAVRAGNKLVVSGGLTLMAIGFLWISQSSSSTPYLETIGQMIVTAGGVGLASAPATEAIMGVVPAAKAGIGSAINDATREMGGTLGVAVIGSVFSSLYIDSLDGSAAAAQLPSDVVDQARDGVGSALGAAGALAQTDSTGATLLAEAAETAFFSGFQAACLVAAAVAIVGAVFAATFLPARPPAQPGVVAVPDRFGPHARARQSAGARAGIRTCDLSD